MSDNDMTTSDTNCERDIDNCTDSEYVREINLNANSPEENTRARVRVATSRALLANETTTDTADASQTKSVTKSFKTVDAKNVGELTDDERAIIIANAKNGVEQPNFDVRFFNNGKFRIVRKKQKPPTISEKVVKTQSIPVNEKKAYYTDNQLLFEHIIELNAKIDRLMSKHKKLKRKYQTLQNDIYIEDDEIESTKHTVEEPIINEPIVNEQPIIQEPPTIPIINNIQSSTATRQNWRSRLRYL